MKKKFFAVATFALAFAVAFSASAYDLGSTTLKRGSKGAAVVQLQVALNNCSAAGLTSDGIFGRGTEAAVKAFQASKMLTADGLAGAITKATLNACATAPATTTTTVALCPNGMTLASNCLMSPSSTTVNSTAEGYLSDIASDSSNRVSTVYESESDKVVVGFRGTAKLADQKVELVKVTFRNDSPTASSNLGKYISSASIWNGSTKLATISVADADRSNSDDTYTFNFTGLNGAIAKDMTGRFYVSVNANGSLDSNDTAYASYAVNIDEIRTTSPNGVYVTTQGTSSCTNVITNASYTCISGVTGLQFGKFSANGVKAQVSLSANNPSAQTIAVSETGTTNEQTLLKFKIEAKNTTLTLRKIPISIVMANNTITSNLADVINSVKLYRGSDQVDNLDGGTNTGGVYYFSNLSASSNTIAAGTSAEFSVVVDLKKQLTGSTGNYSVGTTLTASFTDLSTASFSVKDSNGDQLQAGTSYRSGSAVGSTMTLRTKSVTASAGSASAPVNTIGNSATQQVSFNFPLTLIGTGVDYYVPKAAQFVSSTTMPSSATASKGIYFTVLNSAGSVVSVTPASTVDSTATVYSTSGNVEQLLATSSGTNATLKVTVNGNGTATYYKLVILGFAGSETLNGSLTPYAVDNQSLYTITSNGTVQ